MKTQMGREKERSNYNWNECSWHFKSEIMAMWWIEALKMELIRFCLKNLEAKCDCSTNGRMVFLTAKPSQDLIENPADCFCISYQ